MPRKQLPRSLQKFLRRKKSEIRRQFFSDEEAEAKIRELVSGIFKEYNLSVPPSAAAESAKNRAV